MAVTVETITDNFGNPVIYIQDPTKTEAVYSVEKSKDGYTFYEVRSSQGAIPKILEGKFTKSQDLEKKVVKYLTEKKPTRTVRTKEVSKLRAQKDS